MYCKNNLSTNLLPYPFFSFFEITWKINISHKNLNHSYNFLFLQWYHHYQKDLDKHSSKITTLWFHYHQYHLGPSTSDCKEIFEDM